MRVSDRMTNRNYLKYLEKAKTRFAETNEKIASGNRFVRVSDDVSAGTKVLRVRADMSKTEEYYDNVKTINEELSTTEDALMSIQETLAEAHKKLLNAMTSTTGESGRKAIANEVSAMRDQILQFANTKYYTKFVLGGSTAATAPFSADKNGNLLYNGINVNDIQKDDAGYFTTDAGGKRKPIPMDEDVFADIGLGIRMKGSDIESDTAFKVSYSGLDVLGFGKDANGKPSNVFNILTDAVNKMREGDLDELGKADERLLKFTDKFAANITDIGAKTNFLDNVEKRITTSIDSYKNQVHTLMGINDAEEATNQTMNDYVLKSVLRMGANVLPVSLMDFLR
ncbi:MAG: hypothetical protein RSE64_06735 [Oscillospiraceae bacterium]